MSVETRITLTSVAAMNISREWATPLTIGAFALMAMQAVMKAPLAQVAPLTGRSPDVLLTALKQAGIELGSPDQTLDSVVQGDRPRTGAAMRVLFGGSR